MQQCKTQLAFVDESLSLSNEFFIIAAAFLKKKPYLPSTKYWGTLANIILH
ncbi:MAG: hypothetical protein H7334_09145 [Ferruginibacter sp.]|nr:hypothetical protein [Ferruginibacter sp.]